MDKRLTREKITAEMGKTILFLSKAGALITMLGGAVYWVNDKLDLTEQFADYIAEKSAAKVVEAIDPLTTAEYYSSKDSMIARYDYISQQMFSLVEARMNVQDSLLLVTTGLGKKLIELQHGLKILQTKLDTTAQISADHMRADSIQSAYLQLQEELHFSSMLNAMRQNNSKVIDNIRIQTKVLRDLNKGEKRRWNFTINGRQKDYQAPTP